MNGALLTLRNGLVALTVLGVLGLAVELATERHWRSPEQLIPWGALILLLSAVALLASGDAPRRVAVVRALSLAVVLVGVFGIYAHVAANYDAGPLDRRYAATWETLPAASRWWYALTRSVGPAPPFAPGALVQTALVLLLATCAPSGGRGKAPAHPRGTFFFAPAGNASRSRGDRCGARGTQEVRSDGGRARESLAGGGGRPRPGDGGDAGGQAERG